MSGREEILEALGRGGAVNVFGLPGVGKTSALASLGEGDGYTLVDLSGVQDLELKLMAALGPEAGTWLEALSRLEPGHVLMFDHVDAHADELGEAWAGWRSSAPEVRFVFASRSALMWPGVRDVRVMGLDDARARALLGEVAPGWLEGAPAVVAEELLGLLDGNPLALGFAGRRARLLTPGQLLERLNERVDVLRAPRMELSVVAVLDEVWESLGEDAKLAACRASVFASPQPIEAYERVLVDGRLDAVSLLDALDELDAYGALRVVGGTMRPSRLLAAHGSSRAPEDDAQALVARHAAWVTGLCAGWLERTSARPRELLVEVAPYLEELTRAWAHVSGGVGAARGGEYDALARVISALVTHRTSTMTQLGAGVVELAGVAPEVVLERADRMWRSGQTRGAHAALAGAAGAAGLDGQLSARLYGALARVQRELGLWRDAARSFEQVAEHARRAGDRARRRRYAWRQCEALLEAGERAGAARALGRLLEDDAPAGAPSRARVALALASARVGVDPGAARAALGRGEGEYAGAQVHEAEMRRGDADYVEGAYASALERYEALPAGGEVTRRLVELWCVTGAHERALESAEDALRGGVARWIGGDPLGAAACWREAEPGDELEAERLELLARAASGEPLGEALRAEPTRRVLGAWSRDEELDVTGPTWPGEGGAGWLARVLALHPRTRRAPVSAALLAKSQREGAWIVLASGEGFVSPASGFVSLREKQTLARVLAALACRHAESPGDPLDFDEAYALGWPDQPHTPTDSARNRLRVAIRRLRDSGLRPVLMTKPTGYHLSTDASVMIHSM